MSPPLGLRPPAGLIPAPKVADFCSAPWPVFTPPLTGAPVAFTYTDGILGNGCLAILKGSDNVEAAQKFIAGVVAPETQARIPEMMPYYGPTNQKAFEVATFSGEVLAASNTAPANTEKQVIIDVNWWAENAPLVQEDYKMMMVE